MMALFSPTSEQHRLGWTPQCAQTAKSETRRRNARLPEVWHHGWPRITLTSAEVNALAESLRARATSLVLSDAPSQQSDGPCRRGAAALQARMVNLSALHRKGGGHARDGRGLTARRERV
jgi:hypothetical protein